MARDPAIGDGESLAAVAFHAGKGQQAGHLPGAADEQGHGAAVLAADMDFAPEDEHHVLGWCAFFKEDLTGSGNQLTAVMGEPETVFQSQAVQRADAVDGFRDFFGGSRTGRGSDGGGEHPGTSGLAVSG